MADRYVNTALGSNGDGSSGSPWNRIPNTASGDAAGNTLSAGDAVYVQVGSSTLGERLVVSADNLQFRPWHAYGEADPLLLTLPAVGRPWLARQLAVNRGMWTVQNSTGAGSCVAYGTNRVGVTLDGVHVIGDAGSGVCVAMGLSSTATGTGNALVNSRVSPYLASANNGVNCNTLNTLLRRVKVDGAGSDTVNFGTAAANGNRAGSIDRVIECQIGPANQATLTSAKSAQTGDELQYQNGTLNAGVGNLVVKGCYLFKNSAGKQAMLIGGQGWNYIVGNLVEAEPSTLMTGLGSDVPNGATIMVNAGWGRNIVVGNVLRNRRNGFTFAGGGIAALRVVDGQDVTDSTRSTTDTLFLSNLLDLDGASAFSLGGTVNGGRVRVIGNTCIGTVEEMSGNNGTTAAAAGFTYEESENAWLASADEYMLNWSQLSAAFTFRNNRYGAAALGYRVMSTDYATAALGIAALEAAGCDATGSAELLDALVTEYGIPYPASPLLLNGDALLRYRRTLHGHQRRRHIGAFGALAPYTVV